MSGAKVIVVGGGLSGLSAAHTVLERGGNVVSTRTGASRYTAASLLTKLSSSSTRTRSWVYVPASAAINQMHPESNSHQGNSTKATSGINGSGTAVSILDPRVIGLGY